MTRDDIIRMYEKANGWSPKGWDKTVDELERFAELVAEAECEECAKVCEAEGKRVDASWASCAFAIRERGAP